MTFKVGDCILFSWEDKFGKIIMETTKSKWTHVGIIAEIKPNGYLVYEAVDRGFVNTQDDGDLNIYEFDFLDGLIGLGQAGVRRADESLSNVKENCDKYLGKHYSYITLFFIYAALKYPFLSKILPDPSGLICSEGVAKVLYDSSKTINIAKEFDIPFWEVTPADLADSQQLYWVGVKI